MEPTEALRSIEIRLRLVIEEALGSNWIAQLAPSKQKRIESWRQNEAARRGAHAAQEALINFTTTDDLRTIIAGNWELFSEVFPDRAEFDWLMKTITDVRNTIAHSRTLLPYERELLSGSVGSLNQMIAQHRAHVTNSRAYYPLIERAQDNYGTDWVRETSRERAATHPVDRDLTRVDVGDLIVMQCASTPVRGKRLVWKFWAQTKDGLMLSAESNAPDQTLHGDIVEFTHRVTEDNVREDFGIVILLRTDSRYVRNTESYTPAVANDDVAFAYYSVNPND